ncbi:MAG: tetratricopeptide repeat protein [Hydrogenophilales bacterium]|nr:tetratricopeptide repeat protein [Hydrogenophilales bacterium]
MSVPATLENLLIEAHRLFSLRDFPAAEAHCQHALSRYPGDPNVLHLLGAIAAGQGQAARAAAYFEIAAKSLPENPQVFFNLGSAQLSLVNPVAAQAAFARALALRPDFPEALNNLGCALEAQEQYVAAQARFEQALECAPRFVDARANLGRVLLRAGSPEAAKHQLEQALLMAPDHVSSLHYLGLTEKALGNYAGAEAALSQAVHLQPRAPELRNNLGNVLVAQGKYAAAMTHYAEALALEPHNPAAALNLANALSRQGFVDEAIARYDQALALKPDLAEAQWGRALAYLQKGDLVRGWEGYEWRFLFQQAYPHRYAKPYWNGEPFAGKRLLIYDEIGYGDVFQFARYLPLVKARGGTVLFEVKPGLQPALRGLAGVDQWLERSVQAVDESRFDLHLPLESLPGVFGTTLDTIPSGVPYLFADDAVSLKWRARIAPSPALKVGLVWAGNPDSAYDQARSCTLRDLAPLLEIPGCRFYSLQVGKAASDMRDAGVPLIPLGEDFRDFGDTAAAMSQLDLIITVETAAAHLAGALGKPAWVLLAKVPAWRWLLDRADSPWYPTLRLFRQTQAGDWASVIAALAQALEQYVKVHHGNHE